MKDRCIDDVAIRYSFVSRNYRKALSSCTTIFWRFRYMKIHIFALRWKDEIRRSSQLRTLLKLVVISRTWKKFFRPVRDLNPWPLRYRCSAFFSRGVASRGNDKKRLRDNRCDELHCHVTAAQLQLLSSHLLPQYFFCWVRYVPDEIRKKLSWKRQP